MKSKLREFITENFLFGSDEDGFDDDDSFLDNGIIDSTGVLELVSYIEEEFEMEVRDEELVPDNFDSLNKLVSYIQNKS
ncbi:MAG: acyl carrier protein [Candidatus Latescibacteria bacterium]|nr:acyl carrier protein [bacterium]MBD3425281.1 acyl carrier protein [Candidatus Latescibacterota bacterium]